jgi:hypothetical protein
VYALSKYRGSLGGRQPSFQAGGIRFTEVRKRRDDD